MVIFVLQNKWIIENEYSIRYFLYESPLMPLWGILLIDLFLGIFFGICYYFVNHAKLKRVLHQNRKKIEQMEKELVSLRNLPIIEDHKEETSLKTI
jgi:hypothetical protein